MERLLTPEILDELPPADPQAVASRRDLVRLNRIMGHARWMARQLQSLRPEPAPRRLVELGSGDGTMMLDTARRLGAAWRGTQVQLVDRCAVVEPSTIAAFADLGWAVEFLEADVETFLAAGAAPADCVLANLFLHHFSRQKLSRLFQLVQPVTRAFVACEPRRSTLALWAAWGVGLIGCNRVTRHDAVVSVRAGFAARELAALWPATGSWQIAEGRVGLFTHGFVVHRKQAG